MKFAKVALAFMLLVALILLSVGPTVSPVKADDGAGVDLEVTVGLRGDADDSGAVDIFDAMYIAQYVVGIRSIDELNFLNAASVKHDEPEDIIDIFDAMFIAQYIVGLRDSNFEWID